MRLVRCPNFGVWILVPPYTCNFFARTYPNVWLFANVLHKLFERHHPSWLADHAVVHGDGPVGQLIANSGGTLDAKENNNIRGENWLNVHHLGLACVSFGVQDVKLPFEQFVPIIRG
jgi:hypothetical protein